MNKRNILMATFAGLSTFAGNFLKVKQDYSQRKVIVNTYKTGGRSFTRGKRSKSLKTRANKSKAKAKHKGK